MKILNFGGAIRFDDVHSNVTHIIVGQPNRGETSLLKEKRIDAPIVTLHWLVESLIQKQAIVDCGPFLYLLHSNKPTDLVDADAPSPATKKSIMSMNNSFKKPNPKKLVFPTAQEEKRTTDAGSDSEDLLLDQYIHSLSKAGEGNKANSSGGSVNSDKEENAKKPEEQGRSSASICASSEFTSEFTETVDFLRGKSVHIRGFDKESSELLIQDCRSVGAEVILDENYGGVVDYLIVSMDILTIDDIRVKAKTIVNQNWLFQSKNLGVIADLPYFFKPIIFREDLKPLQGMIVVFSLYPGDERSFLVQLADMLGAEVQDAYKRNSRPLLICPTPDNAKYNAAIKWGEFKVDSFEGSQSLLEFSFRIAGGHESMAAGMLSPKEAHRFETVFGRQVDCTSE